MDKKSNSSEHTLMFYLLLCYAFILPWPHGGEIDWQYLTFALPCFLMLGWALLHLKKAPNLGHSTNIKWAMLLLVSWANYPLLQLIPLPTYLLELISPNSAALHDEVNPLQEHHGSDQWQSISISPNTTFIEFAKHASYVCTFIIALILLNSRARILMLANTLFFSSAIIALYSLINHFTGGVIDLVSSIAPWTISWDKAAHGTFSYQNHYASFLTLTIPLGFGLIYFNRTQQSQVKKTMFEKAITLFSSINILYTFSILIMLVTLLKTASRGGNSVFIASVIVTMFCVLLNQKRSALSKLTVTLKYTGGALFIVGTLLLLGTMDSLVQRMDKQGFSPNGRDLMQQTVKQIIYDYPAFGSGAGTYPLLQHKYKSEKLGTSLMSKRAHNDYLELLANQGLIGSSLLGASILLLASVLFRGLDRHQKTSRRGLYGIRVACFCSFTAIVLHSIVDFNFHLPVNSVYFYLILALGLSAQR